MPILLTEACRSGDLSVLAAAIATAERAAAQLACRTGLDDDLSLTDAALSLRTAGGALNPYGTFATTDTLPSREEIAGLVVAVLDGLTTALQRDGVPIAAAVAEAAVALGQAHLQLTGRLPQ